MRKAMGADMMMRQKRAHEVMASKGKVLRRVKRCCRSLWSVCRGSVERSRRCNAAVTARTSGVVEVGTVEGRPTGESLRARRRNGERIIRGKEALGPEEKDARRGSDMMVTLKRLLCAGAAFIELSDWLLYSIVSRSLRCGLRLSLIDCTQWMKCRDDGSNVGANTEQCA